MYRELISDIVYSEEGKEKGFGPSVPRFLGSVTLGQIDPFLATNRKLRLLASDTR